MEISKPLFYTPSRGKYPGRRSEVDTIQRALTIWLKMSCKVVSVQAIKKWGSRHMVPFTRNLVPRRRGNVQIHSRTELLPEKGPR